MSWYSPRDGTTVLAVDILPGYATCVWWHRHDMSRPVRSALDHAAMQGLLYMTLRFNGSGGWGLICDRTPVLHGLGAYNVAISPAEFGWLFSAWPGGLRVVDDSGEELVVRGHLLEPG